VEILEIPEEGRLIIEPPVEKPATGEAFVETTAVDGVMPLESAPEDVTGSKVDSPIVPIAEVFLTDTATIEDTPLEVI